MVDDFIAISHKLPPRSIKVWAVADVHIGSKECDLDGFKAFLSRVMAEDDSYIVLCGDIINNGVKDSLTNVYDETIPPSAQIELAAELLRPLADGGRILGAVGGNHEARSRKAVDLDPMYSIMCIIGKPELYRRNMALVALSMENGKIYERYKLLLMHGKTANKKKQFAYALEGVDVLITGHTHDGIVEKPARLCFDKNGNASVKTLVCVTATSWLKAGGYGLSSMYQPKTTSDPQCILLEYVNSNGKKGRVRVSW